jgi:hypothetical protein
MLVALVWLSLYIGIPVFQVAVAAAFLTRSKDVAALKPTPKPGQPAQVQPAQVQPAQVRHEEPNAVRHEEPNAPVSFDELFDASPKPSVPDPLEEPVVLDAAKERLLLHLHANLAKHHDIQEAAAFGLATVVKRVAAFEGQIKSDIRSGGPMSDPDFRRRWNALVNPAQEATWSPLAEPDTALEGDILASRSVPKRRLKALADYARSLRERLNSALSWERSLAEFLPALPVAKLFSTGDPRLVENLRKQLGNQAFLRQAFVEGGFGVRVNMPLGPEWGLMNGHIPIACEDVFVMLTLGPGLVRSAYRVESMDVDGSAAGLTKAEGLLRGFLEGGPFDGPETWTARIAPPPPAAKADTKPENAAAVAPFPGRYRQWTDSRGRPFYGRITGAKDGQVRLERPGGKGFWHPTINLSDRDRDYVESFLAGREPPDDGPAPRRPRKKDPAKTAMDLIFPR